MIGRISECQGQFLFECVQGVTGILISRLYSQDGFLRDYFLLIKLHRLSDFKLSKLLQDTLNRLRSCDGKGLRLRFAFLSAYSQFQYYRLCLRGFLRLLSILIFPAFNGFVSRFFYSLSMLRLTPFLRSSLLGRAGRATSSALRGSSRCFSSDFGLVIAK